MNFLPAFRLLLGAVLVIASAGTAFTALTGVSQQRYDSARSAVQESAATLAALSTRIGEASRKSTTAMGLPRALLWDATAPGGAAVEMQRALLDLAASSGMTVASYGSANGPASVHHETIGLEIEATADYPSLAKYLADLEAMTPRVALAGLWIGRSQVAPEHPEVGRVEVRMVLWGFLAAEGTGQ